MKRRPGLRVWAPGQVGGGGQGQVPGLAAEHGPSHRVAATQLQSLLYAFLEKTWAIYGKSLHCSGLAFSREFSQTLRRSNKTGTGQLRLAGRESVIQFASAQWQDRGSLTWESAVMGNPFGSLPRPRWNHLKCGQSWPSATLWPGHNENGGLKKQGTERNSKAYNLDSLCGRKWHARQPCLHIVSYYINTTNWLWLVQWLETH